MIFTCSFSHCVCCLYFLCKFKPNLVLVLPNLLPPLSWKNRRQGRLPYHPPTRSASLFGSFFGFSVRCVGRRQMHFSWPNQLRLAHPFLACRSLTILEFSLFPACVYSLVDASKAISVRQYMLFYYLWNFKKLWNFGQSLVKPFKKNNYLARGEGRKFFACFGQACGHIFILIPLFPPRPPSFQFSLTQKALFGRCSW